MKMYFKSIAALAFCIACVMQLNAQKDSSSTNENIIIHKKGAVTEKLNIVIDGDNITVNGKPVDDFRNENIDIIKQDAPDVADMDIDVPFNYDMAPPPMPPNAPQVRAFSNDMRRTIKTNSAFLGVMSEKTDKGAKITEVTDESSAEKAGLKTGDVITKINDVVINGPDDLYKAVGNLKPEDKASISYLRDGKTMTTQAVLGKSSQVKVYSWNSPDQQFDLKKMMPGNFAFAWSDKPRLGIEAQDTDDGDGVKITDINDDDSPAAKAGLKENDIITQVADKKITSVDNLRESIKDIKKGDTIKITYKRNNQTQTVDVKIPKELKTIDL